MRFNRRGRYFNRYYTCVSEMADSFLLEKKYLAISVPTIASANSDWQKTRTIRSMGKRVKNVRPGRAKGHYSGLIEQWLLPLPNATFRCEEDEVLKYIPFVTEYWFRLVQFVELSTKNSILSRSSPYTGQNLFYVEASVTKQNFHAVPLRSKCSWKFLLSDYPQQALIPYVR